MSKRTINTGQLPGNLGDGDTLRDAFVKANTNFDELYTSYPVIDTSLDHDDPTVDGTIAKALLDAEAAGGGLVIVGAGVFKCPGSTLDIPKNVILKGIGRVATTIRITGPQDGIKLSQLFSGVESLMLEMPTINSGSGINIRTNHSHLRDLLIVGADPNSWGIYADRSNICKIDNVAMGTIGPFNFFGNGILFNNTDPAGAPFNFGDSILIKVDIALSASDTTGIKFQGPDDTNQVINNILLSQVEVAVENSRSGCIGIHLQNAKRITFNHVDLENLDIAVIEESTGSGNNHSSNNVFISTFVLGANTSYQSSGTVNRRLFLGCDNLTPDVINPTDVMLPRALWLSDTNCRIEAPANGQLTIDDGGTNNGIRFVVNSDTPTIQPESQSSSAQITLGRNSSQGVECLPGIILPPHTSPFTNAIDGTVAQFAAGIVGAQRGLYHLRGDTWFFLG